MTKISRCTSVMRRTFSVNCRTSQSTAARPRLHTGSWGLRDYGTGTWDGGDAPDCDHTMPSRVDAVKATATSTLVGSTDTQGHLQEPSYRDTCGKCGAIRVDRQLGLEPTPDQYVANMVAVFREVRRVLRADGTLWLNIGDSYASGGGAGNQGESGAMADRSVVGSRITRPRGGLQGGTATVDASLGGGRGPGLKPKDLVGIPWRLAFALQADGWYLRSDIIWSKPNPMPESVTDRPTKAHEYLFLLSKSPRYFYDADAIREPAEWARWGDQTNGKYEGKEGAASWIGPKPKSALTPPETSQPTTSLFVTSAVTPGTSKTASETCGDSPTDSSVSPVLRGDRGTGQNNDRNDRGRGGFYETEARGRNKRSVWEIATEAYPDAHFATFPQALVEPCVKAGTSEHGCCPECGAPWERVTELTPEYAALLASGKAWRTDEGKPDAYTNRQPKDHPANVPQKNVTTGWRPSCTCLIPALDGSADPWIPPPVPAVILDPFLGSGTTAQVARRLGRKCVGIELNPEYAELAARRLQQLSLFAVETAEA